MTPEDMMGFKNWAVIGVKPDKDQYAHMIYSILKEEGYAAYPVNPKFEMLGDDVCYPSVADIPYDIDVVDLIVNPQVGAKLLDGIAAKNVKYLWLQPGSHDDKLINEIEKMKFVYVKDCILARLKLKRQRG